jgi:hypothetical protein
MQGAIVEVDPLVTHERLIVDFANACAGFLASLHACSRLQKSLGRHLE